MEVERNWGVWASGLALEATPDPLEIAHKEEVTSTVTAKSWI